MARLDAERRRRRLACGGGALACVALASARRSCFEWHLPVAHAPTVDLVRDALSWLAGSITTMLPAHETAPPEVVLPVPFGESVPNLGWMALFLAALLLGRLLMVGATRATGLSVQLVATLALHFPVTAFLICLLLYHSCQYLFEVPRRKIGEVAFEAGLSMLLSNLATCIAVMAAQRCCSPVSWDLIVNLMDEGRSMFHPVISCCGLISIACMLIGLFMWTLLLVALLIPKVNSLVFTKSMFIIFWRILKSSKIYDQVKGKLGGCLTVRQRMLAGYAFGIGLSIVENIFLLPYHALGCSSVDGFIGHPQPDTHEELMQRVALLVLQALFDIQPMICGMLAVDGSAMWPFLTGASTVLYYLPWHQVMDARPAVWGLWPRAFFWLVTCVDFMATWLHGERS